MPRIPVYRAGYPFFAILKYLYIHFALEYYASILFELVYNFLHLFVYSLYIVLYVIAIHCTCN